MWSKFMEWESFNSIFRIGVLEISILAKLLTFEQWGQFYRSLSHIATLYSVFPYIVSKYCSSLAQLNSTCVKTFLDAKNIY